MDHDDKEHAALNKFGQLWQDKFAADSLLVFSTGRSHALYEELRVGAACLCVPDLADRPIEAHNPSGGICLCRRS